MDNFHQRLAQIAFDAGEDLGLVLAGGYAIAMHELTSRPSHDVDFATASSLPLPQIVAQLADAYRAEGLTVAVIEVTRRMARMDVHAGTRMCEVDLLKEAIGPPARFKMGPVLAIDDAIGLKMRALHDRALHRDFIDVHAAARSGYTPSDLECFGRRHAPHFVLSDLADRLASIDDRDDRTFTDYGLDDQQIRDLRAWATGWEGDIRLRLSSAAELPPRPEEPDWDAYLDNE